MAETLKDFLVGIKFQTDQGGARSASKAIADLDTATQELANVLLNAAQAFSDLIAQMQGGAQTSKKFGTAMGEGAKSAGLLANLLGKTNKEARMSGMDTGKKKVTEFDKAMKEASSTLKRYAKLAVGYFIGSNVTKTFIDLMDFNEGLIQNAKKLNKTVEDTRAYNIALQTMGKTIDEINKDGTLKQTFNDLQAIGKELALPEAAAGLRNIAAVKDSLMQLKVTGSYALQWIYYRMQEVAAGPLARMREILGNIRTWFSGNIGKIADAVGKVFSWIVQIVNSVATAIGKLFEAFNKLPNSIKIALGAILVVLGMIFSPAFRIFALLSGILLLIDDFITHQQGGKSQFGDFWDSLVEKFEASKPAIEEFIQKVDELLQHIKETWEESKSIPEFFQRLILGDEYTDESTWEDVGRKIWDSILAGLRGGAELVTDLIADLLLGNDKAAQFETMAEKWKAVGALIGEAMTSGIDDSVRSFFENTLGIPSWALDILSNPVQAGANAARDVQDWVFGLFGLSRPSEEDRSSLSQTLSEDQSTEKPRVQHETKSESSTSATKQTGVPKRGRTVSGTATEDQMGGTNLDEAAANAEEATAKIDSSVSTHLSNAAKAAAQAAASIEAAFNNMAIGLSGVLPGMALGGAFSHPTRALIGEDGKEYVIPVTKPQRALPLIMSALRDMGFTAQGYRSAINALGGSAYAGVTPGYAYRGAASSVTTNHNTNTVTAPATINVYGRDAQAIANQVSYNQQKLVLRNLKSAIVG